MESRIRARIGLAAAALAIAPSVAAAHPGPGAHAFGEAFAHPFGGADHLLAMGAVGLLAAWTAAGDPSRRAALWALPLAFVGAMTAGGALGAAGTGVPFVEEGILASVLLLGVVVASAARWPLSAGAPLVALCAVLHGHAHGTELAAGGSLGVAQATGFVAATLLIHGAGIVLGTALARRGREGLYRIAGAAVALGGAALLVAA